MFGRATATICYAVDLRKYGRSLLERERMF